MIEGNDWRLMGQEEYLYGIHLQWKAYELGYPGYDHEHCEFCWQKIASFDAPDVEREGYATEDNCRWVCRQCFDDFRVMFAWELD